MRLNEIDFSNGFKSTNVSLIDLNKSTFFGTSNNEDIYVFTFDEVSAFFIKREEDIAAYIILENSGIDNYFSMIRMENISKYKGLISTITNYLLSKGIKLKIKNSEPLTKEGFNWIKKLILRNDPTISIVDQNGLKINLPELENEYKNVENSLLDITTDIRKRYIGPTAILISKI